MTRYSIIAAVALIASAVPGWTQDSRQAPLPCTPAMGLNYICNLGRPEDFLWIPDTKYIIKHQSVVTFRWFSKLGEFAIAPVVIAGINNNTASRTRVDIRDAMFFM